MGISAVILKKPVWDYVPVAGIHLLLLPFISALVYPVIYKYGIEKARYIYILVTMVMALVVIGGASALKLETVSESVMLAGIPAFAAVLALLGICTVIDAVAVFLSYQISLKIVKKREW